MRKTLVVLAAAATVSASGAVTSVRMAGMVVSRMIATKQPTPEIIAGKHSLSVDPLGQPDQHNYANQ